MPRGAKLDRERTKLARRGDLEGYPRIHSPSFIALSGCMFLAGIDRCYARERAVKRATVPNGFVRCQICGCTVYENVNECHPQKAEMHHIERKPRCDCDHNLQMICGQCHRGRPGSIHP